MIKRIKSIDWECGGGMIMLCIMILWLLMLGTFVVLEVGGWFYTTAACQTKTDAIAEGVSIMTDSGVVVASGVIDYATANHISSDYGLTSALSMPHKNASGATDGYYKTLTELNDNHNDSHNKAVAMRDRLVNANTIIMPNIVENFTYNDNLDGTAHSMSRITYDQRIYEGVGYVDASTFTGLYASKSSKGYTTYTRGTNARILVIGDPLPVADSDNFSFMYPDDPRIPVSALTNNTGAESMWGVFDFTDTSTYNWNSVTGELDESIPDHRTPALYESVLDQFDIENNNERYKNSLSNTKYRVYFFNEDHTELGLKGNDYVYKEDSSYSSTIGLTPQDTLLWDVATAMHINLPRYAGSGSSEYYFSDWMKGHEGVKLNKIDLNSCSKIQSIGSLSDAINEANQGNIVFADSGSAYYFIRPAESDGTAEGYGGDDNTFVNVLYIDKDGNGRNNVAYTGGSFSGMNFYMVKDN